MSNEPHSAPATLRLKPRLRPADGAGTDAASSAPVVAPQSPLAVENSPETPKVRLRPKLVPPVSDAPPPVPATIPPSVVATVPPPPVAVKPPVPPLFITDPVPTPAVIPPASSSSSTAAPAPGGDPGRFKLKPKASVPAPAPTSGVSTGSTPPVPLLFLPDDAPSSVLPVTTPGGSAPAFPPPGPAAPMGRGGRTIPPFHVPHVKLKTPELPPAADLSVPVERPVRGGLKKALVVVLVLFATGYGVYLGWPHLPAEISVAGFTIRTKPGLSFSKGKSATASALPTPSETLNKLAHLPGNAIDKAQEAIAARRASGQDRVDAAAKGEDAPAAPTKPAAVAASASRAAPDAASVTTIAPGPAVPPPVEATPEASAEFRAYVTNIRISGIFQGNPARAVINGKLTRAGEAVDSGYGITFEGLDGDRKNLVFKDRSGATVTRRF